MNYLLGVERVLLANFARMNHEENLIDDKTLTDLAYFYGYDPLHHALKFLKYTKHLTLYRTRGDYPRRLYQFHGKKNQLSVYTLSTSHFCTCSFYKNEILIEQKYFACPHNIAVKLYEQMCPTNVDVDIEMFDVDDDFLIDKLAKLVEQSCEFF